MTNKNKDLKSLKLAGMALLLMCTNMAPRLEEPLGSTTRGGTVQRQRPRSASHSSPLGRINSGLLGYRGSDYEVKVVRNLDELKQLKQNTPQNPNLVYAVPLRDGRKTALLYKNIQVVIETEGPVIHSICCTCHKYSMYRLIENIIEAGQLLIRIDPLSVDKRYYHDVRMRLQSLLDKSLPPQTVRDYLDIMNEASDLVAKYLQPETAPRNAWGESNPSASSSADSSSRSENVDLTIRNLAGEQILEFPTTKEVLKALKPYQGQVITRRRVSEICGNTIRGNILTRRNFTVNPDLSLTAVMCPYKIKFVDDRDYMENKAILFREMQRNSSLVMIRSQFAGGLRTNTIFGRAWVELFVGKARLKFLANHPITFTPSDTLLSLLEKIEQAQVDSVELFSAIESERYFDYNSTEKLLHPNSQVFKDLFHIIQQAGDAAAKEVSAAGDEVLKLSPNGPHYVAEEIKDADGKMIKVSITGTNVSITSDTIWMSFSLRESPSIPIPAKVNKVDSLLPRIFEQLMQHGITGIQIESAGDGSARARAWGVFSQGGIETHYGDISSNNLKLPATPEEIMWIYENADRVARANRDYITTGHGALPTSIASSSGR